MAKSGSCNGCNDSPDFEWKTRKMNREKASPLFSRFYSAGLNYLA